MSASEQLLAIGLNHHSANIEIRERFAFAPDSLPQAHQALRQLTSVRECAILTTCNRTELYVLHHNNDQQQQSQRILRWLHSWFDLQQDLSGHFYIHQQQAAIRHLLRVTAGLDSLVLGEPQISGQVKTALQHATQNENGAAAAGTIMQRLFATAFSCNKLIRQHTELGQQPVTVPYACVNLAQQIFADLSNAGVLLVGAGDMIQLCAQHFSGQRVRQLIIANRNPQNAAQLLDALEQRSSVTDYRSIGLQQLPDYLEQADIIVTSTASQQPLLSVAMFKQALKQRRHRPVLAVDIAVPRNIEPQVNELNDVYLYSIDDLTTVLESNRQSRASAAAAAEQIVAQQAGEFIQWLALHNASTHLQQFRQQATRYQQQLLQQAQLELDKQRPAEQVMQQFARRFTQRTLHGLTLAMRKAAVEDNQALLEALQNLFDDSESESSPDRPD